MPHNLRKQRMMLLCVQKLQEERRTRMLFQSTVVGYRSLRLRRTKVCLVVFRQNQQWGCQRGVCGPQTPSDRRESSRSHILVAVDARPGGLGSVNFSNRFPVELFIGLAPKRTLLCCQLAEFKKRVHSTSRSATMVEWQSVLITFPLCVLSRLEELLVMPQRLHVITEGLDGHKEVRCFL